MSKIAGSKILPNLSFLAGFFHHVYTLMLGTVILTTCLPGISTPQVKIVCSEFREFNNGLASFKADNKWGFIDTTGNIVIKPVHFDYWGKYDFSDSLCPVMDEKGRFGYINIKGDTVIPFIIYKPAIFHQDIAIFYQPASAAKAGSKARWSLINNKGKLIADDTPVDNSYSTELIEGMARCRRNYLYGFIDTTGKEVIQCKYEDVRDFSEGLAAVKSNNKWGFVDKAGNIKIDFLFRNEPMPFSDGFTFIQGTNDKWALIDTAYKIYTQPVYKTVSPFRGGYAVVSTEENYMETFMIINRKGKEVKSFPVPKGSYEPIVFRSAFYEGIAVAQKGYGNFGAINNAGQTVVDFKFAQLRPFHNGLAYAEKYDEKTRKTTRGFINKKGNFVIVMAESSF